MPTASAKLMHRAWQGTCPCCRYRSKGHNPCRWRLLLLCVLLLQVNAAKAALEVALTRATQQRSAYEPYRDMARYDHQLDLASLAPVYKATCAMAAKALTGAQSAQGIVLHAT